MSSAVYQGWVRHRRHAPRAHEFQFRLFMLFLDLDELEQLNQRSWLFSTRSWAPLRFVRGDHWGDPERPLKECVLDLVERQLGFRPQGPVRLLTQPRCWGYCFNPISIYYCYDTSDSRLAAVIAEVTNTPWRERRCYVLAARDNLATGSWWFEKTLHVSPFMPMDQAYRWRGRAPANGLCVHLESHQSGRKVLDATLSLRYKPLSHESLRSTLLTHPFMTAKTILGIHWEALRLWAKGIPVHPCPIAQTSALEEPR